MTEPLLELAQLRFGAGGHALAPAIDLSLEPGQVLTLLGPNGAGKSTLFRTLLGLVTPVSGEVRWHGKPLGRYRPAELAGVVAYVPQTPGAAFDFDVHAYVMMGRLGRLGLLGAPGSDDRASVGAAIERMGLQALRRRRLSDLSGGERQLCAIARALAQGADALVLDEPSASLDVSNRARVLELLVGLARDGLAVLCSTHEPNDALVLGGSCLLLAPGQQARSGAVVELVEPASLSLAYGAGVEEAVTVDGRRVIVPKIGS